MVVPRLTVQVESDCDRDPFLTEGSIDFHEHEHDHVIDVTNCDYTSTSSSQGGYNSSHEAHNEDWTLTSSLANASRLSTSTTTYSRSASLRRSGETHGQRHRNLLDSRLCISVLLLANVVQIFTAVVVLSFSRHEHTRAPLFTWVIGYTVGCIANLPRLYYRYIHPNYQDFDQEPAPVTTSVSRVDQNNIVVSSRPSALIGHFKVGLECFFVVWFVVGNVWVFGSRSSTADAPNLYRLCIAFLALSCIGYAMPFILCVTICCCFPCLISFLGFRENLPLTKGATSELINALPTYKFKSQRSQNRGSSQTREESFEGGILAAGTDKERIVSPEDAVCCICLAAYAENDDLRELPCTHSFHADCVDKWLKINALCPLCKYIVARTAGFSSLVRYLGRNTPRNRSVGSSSFTAEYTV